jgi:hypothetical protein
MASIYQNPTFLYTIVAMENYSDSKTVKTDLIRLAVIITIIAGLIVGLKIADSRTGLVKKMGNDLYSKVIRN